MIVLHVVFKVGEVDYVLPASEVVQMESFTQATHVPGAPPWVAGLVQIRGQVMPVIDLRARFGLPPIARSLESRIVVVNDGGRQVGLLADSAREVLRLESEDFHSPPEIITSQTHGFVSQVAQAGKRLVMRIDFLKVISQEPTSKELPHGQEIQERRVD